MGTYPSHPVDQVTEISYRGSPGGFVETDVHANSFYVVTSRQPSRLVATFKRYGADDIDLTYDTSNWTLTTNGDQQFMVHIEAPRAPTSIEVFGDAAEEKKGMHFRHFVRVPARRCAKSKTPWFAPVAGKIIRKPSFMFKVDTLKIVSTANPVESFKFSALRNSYPAILFLDSGRYMSASPFIYHVDWRGDSEAWVEVIAPGAVERTICSTVEGQVLEALFQPPDEYNEIECQTKT